MPRDRKPPVTHDVSPLTVNRLSIYLRSLRRLESEGAVRISSEKLARRFHLSSAQIRKDLAHFGEFGVRGVGYDVHELAERLAGLLGLDRVHRVGIVGMGNIGTALALSPSFNTGSFVVVAGFDKDPARCGQRVGSILIRPTTELVAGVRRAGVTIAVVAVPAEAAARVHDRLVEAGVPAILNFSPVALPSVPSCRVKNVDLRVHLEELAFFLEEP